MSKHSSNHFDDEKTPDLPVERDKEVTNPGFGSTRKRTVTFVEPPDSEPPPSSTPSIMSPKSTTILRVGIALVALGVVVKCLAAAGVLTGDVGFIGEISNLGMLLIGKETLAQSRK